MFEITILEEWQLMLQVPLEQTKKTKQNKNTKFEK
jgi:hypothetical protein